MKKCTIVIKDEVNIRFQGLNKDTKIRRQLVNSVKFFVPYAYHMPIFKLGRWDGYKSYCTMGGETYLNLLDKMLPVLTNAGYEINIDDRRTVWNLNFPSLEDVKKRLASRTWPKGHTNEAEPIVLRDYQEEALGYFLQNPQSIQEISTGAGKTLLSAAMSMLCEPFGRTIIIVPSKQLVLQTEEDYQNIGLDVGVFFGDRKEIDRQHTICTWQSLNSLDKQTAGKRNPFLGEDGIKTFLADTAMVLVDECHGVKADALMRLLTDPFAHVPIRWGFTGTVPKEDHDLFSLLSCIGPIVHKIEAYKLQEKGVLASLDIKILQTLETVEFSDYHEEHNFLATNKTRIKWLGETVIDIAKTGNTLLLVDRIETGEMIKEMIPEAMFVHGSVKVKTRKKHFDEINVSDGNIIVATYGTAAVGLNVPRIFNLVLLESGKSFIRVIQSIGRSIRIAKDKNSAMVYDITSNCKYSKKHLTERKKYYKNAKYPFTIEKVRYGGSSIIK